MHKDYILLISAILSAIEEQENMTKKWHAIDIAPEEETTVLSKIIIEQHKMNYDLWHTEDIARRKDVDASVIADCKYKIDVYNQKRNDLMEQIDTYCISMLSPFLPSLSETQKKYNSETIGMIIDRLSILALKIYHMQEQTERSDVTSEHIKECTNKLESLSKQRNALITSLQELLEDYYKGIKAPRIYLQHKMYNDPTLNPELYTNAK